jgi:hypothetical protein
MKQRNIKGATLFNPRIYFQSVLNCSTLQCDSHNERDFAIDLEFDDTVIRYVTQPQSFIYEYKGKKRRFTEDFLVERKNGGLERFEIKDARFADSQELRDKIAHLSDLYRKYQNSDLTLVTSKDIHDDPSHVTRKILYKYMGLDVPEELTKIAIKSFCKAEMTIEDLEQRFVQKQVSRTQAWAFLAQHYSSITFLGNPNISSTTIISWGK